MLNIKTKSLLFILFLLVGSPIVAYAAIEDIFEGQTSIEEPFKMRDPFKPPVQKLQKVEDKSISKKSDGNYTNLPELGVVELAKVKVTGVLIGRERRAIIQVDDKNTPFIIKEGARLGLNQAEVRAIVPGGLILVEKVTNIYGETEYLETVIPISK